MVNINNQHSYKTFIFGWNGWGRPNDLLFKNDGTLLISDDLSGTIYRVFYQNITK
jgi:glucose/arabinose dehydrogenase